MSTALMVMGPAPGIEWADRRGIAALYRSNSLPRRAAVGSGRNGLLYGERNAASDFHRRGLIDGWHRDGVLERVDVVFSRDQAQRRYVRHQLAAAADEVRQWVQAGAAVYVPAAASSAWLRASMRRSAPSSVDARSTT